MDIYRLLYKINNKIDWFNIKDILSVYYWEKKKVIITCKRCGQKIAPFIEYNSPTTCGWYKLIYGDIKKKKGYICHQCVDHGCCLSDPEYKKYINDNNKRLMKKIEYYKSRHPFTKIKNI